MMWIFWAGNSWRGPNGGLAKRDWTLNEAGKRFEALMAEWSTTASGVADSAGVFAFQGFHGDYAVKLKDSNACPFLPARSPCPRARDLRSITLQIQKDQ